MLERDVLGFSFKVSHFRFVLKAEVVEEVLGESYVEDSHVLSELLVTDDTKLWHVNGASSLDLGVAPLYKSLPHQIVGRLTNDGPN